MLFAAHKWCLDRKRADGSSERDNLESAQSQIKNLPGWKGKKIIIPVTPPFPFQVEYLWNWFLEFCWGLKSDGMGPTMADWGDVQDWCAAMRLDLEPWEKRLLVRLAYLRAVIDSEKQQAEAKAAHPKSG